MGLLDRIERRSATVDPVHPRDPAIADLFGLAAHTAAGIAITPERALQHDAVYACVRILSETLAQLPLELYRRTDPKGGREIARDHPLYRLLHDRPNASQTSFDWREMMQGHAVLRGNAYSYIEHRGDGTIGALVPMHPLRTRPFRAPDGRVSYAYTPEGGGAEKIYLQHEVLHIPARSFDGVQGHSPIKLQRETIGWAIATRDHGARFFGNSAQAKGAIKIPTGLSDPAATNLREAWERRHKGIENAHRIAILDGGMEWVNIGMSAEDAQLIETAQMQVRAIARIFGVPPSKIADLADATYSNVEHEDLSFVKYTMMPHLVRWEQRCTHWLLSEADRRDHFIEFNVAGLLRGDSKARAEFYRQLFGVAGLSPNEIRENENLNPYEGGDKRFVPLNMAPVDEVMNILLKPSETARRAQAASLGQWPRPPRTPPKKPNGHDDTQELQP